MVDQFKLSALQSSFMERIYDNFLIIDGLFNEFWIFYSKEIL